MTSVRNLLGTTLRLGLFTAIILSLASATPAQRAIPDENLAIPVLITIQGVGTGSGFYIRASKYTYLVTAKHVLFNMQTDQLLAPRMDLLSYSRDPSDPTPNLISVDLAAFNALGNGDNIKASPTADVVVVRLFSNTTTDGTPIATPLPGVVLRSFAKLGIVGVQPDQIDTFDKVLIGNEVFLFGYPNSLALAQLGQLDPNRPLLRKGIVAGTNPARRSIVLDCPSYPGNSGGPVVELIRRGFEIQLRIIGVVDQFVPFVQAAGSQTFAMQFNSNSAGQSHFKTSPRVWIRTGHPSRHV